MEVLHHQPLHVTPYKAWRAIPTDLGLFVALSRSIVRNVVNLDKILGVKMCSSPLECCKSCVETDLALQELNVQR